MTFYLAGFAVGFADGVDGIMGLSAAGTPGTSSVVEEFNVDPRFVDGLYDLGEITERSFSLHVDIDAGENYIDFGAPQNAGLTDSVSYISLTTDGFFWTGIPTGVRFGTASESNTGLWLSEEMPAIFSSTSRINYVPSQESVRFFHKVLDGHDYTY
jgi:hypothetical protein